MTGALSSFLDNAPTYLHSLTWQAAKPGADDGRRQNLNGYFHGRGIYGCQQLYRNAPNFMVLSIVQERGLKMLHSSVTCYGPAAF